MSYGNSPKKTTLLRTPFPKFTLGSTTLATERHLFSLFELTPPPSLSTIAAPGFHGNLFEGKLKGANRKNSLADSGVQFPEKSVRADIRRNLGFRKSVSRFQPVPRNLALFCKRRNNSSILIIRDQQTGKITPKPELSIKTNFCSPYKQMSAFPAKNLIYFLPGENSSGDSAEQKEGFLIRPKTPRRFLEQHSPPRNHSE